MLGKTLRLAGRVHIVLLVLVLAAALCEPTARRYGDRLQVALPMLAWGCSALNRTGSEFAARFVGLLTVVHGSKAILGDAPINQRPYGGGEGFPSGHTAAAAFGASSLVNECISAHPIAKGIVLVSAGFVGASRIDAGKHDVWQVLAGAVLGWGFDRALRRPGRARTGLLATGKTIAALGSQAFVFLRKAAGNFWLGARRRRWTHFAGMTAAAAMVASAPVQADTATTPPDGPVGMEASDHLRPASAQGDF